MNEYVITFINEFGVYQELTFRGVSETVARALAEGLTKYPFQACSLGVKETVARPLEISSDSPPQDDSINPVIEEPNPEPALDQPMAAAKKK